MGSEPDRKRRHLSSISPTPAMAKKQPFSQLSEDKKLGTAVLQYQNQKLAQKLEAQKIEYSALENKFSQLKDKQQPCDSIIKTVNKSWKELAIELESCSAQTRDSNVEQAVKHIPIIKDGGSTPLEDPFLSRFLQTGATECSFGNNCLDQIEDDRSIAIEKAKNSLSNSIAAINDLWHIMDGLNAAVLKQRSGDGVCWQNASCQSEREANNLRLTVGDLHSKNKSVARELQKCRDIDAKSKAELKYLRGELESMVAELERSKCELATLKAERDATKGAFFPVLNIGHKHVAGDRARDKQKELEEMESALKELSDQASSRLLQLKGLHDERINMLQQLSNLQNSLKNVKCISFSQAFVVLRDQVEKSKADALQYQALFEKLQAERDVVLWRERELSMKNDLVDVLRRSSAVSDSRVADLGIEIQKLTNERKMIETKLEEASREPGKQLQDVSHILYLSLMLLLSISGRKEIIADFKALVSSFPEEMGVMQRQLNSYKEAALDIHSLRADIQSLSTVLERKAKECESLSARSASQVVEIKNLKSLVEDLKRSHSELRLLLSMYMRESTGPRDVLEARDLEYKAWGHVQSLKSSLDEQRLELRVKTANEAEARSQQRLAAAEAEIADRRQRLETSKGDMSRLSDVLKSKSEENEAYYSEIETIGQAYDDMQTQNQQLLQQIAERDDYNIKLFLEGVRARQLRDSLLMEKEFMQREIQQSNISLDFYNVKAARISDQLKLCCDQIQKLSEDKFQNSVTLENTQKRLLDVRRASNQARESLDDSQSKIGRSRAALLELQTGSERERFDQGRMEEELEIVRRKISCLQTQTEGSSILEKLQQEHREYREIVKCSVCVDRTKEVVITKCFHLFCNTCIQRLLESRHRKCPACATSFGSNDVKPVYI